MSRARAFAVACVLGLAACDRGPPPQPIVVYAHGGEAGDLAAQLAAFTDDTDIPLNMVYGDSAALTDNVIENRGSPPADVLLTSNVADVWRAADQGALRPIQSQALADMPGAGKDPDGFWVAYATYLAAIGQAARMEIGVVAEYADLANAGNRGEVCLSSSVLPINRAVIAMLMEDKGEKNAERIVRGWVRNLGQAPFANEAELVAALENGTCGYGIFSSTIQTQNVQRLGPRPLYYNIVGLGIARHAHNPDGAQALVDWVLNERAPTVFDHTGTSVGRVGWRDENARLLAERAGYR